MGTKRLFHRTASVAALGSSPKASGCPPTLKKCLTVTEQSQELHFRLVVHAFHEAGRRLRASSKARVRLSSAQFDAYCEFSCIYSAILDEARALSTWDPAKEEAIMKAFMQKNFGAIIPSCSKLFYSCLLDWVQSCLMFVVFYCTFYRLWFL